MALEGTLKDFSLADILQLIGLQRKTGVLTIEGEEDTVTISFLDGKVVSSDSTSKRLENRLGNLLYKAGKISAEQLSQALELQKKTLQRLGFLLIKERMVTPEDLKEALRLQILRIIYRLFRWKDGHYHFSLESVVDYDADHFSPISTEAILMEAARMIDEWPLLQEKVRSLYAVYRRLPEFEGIRLADEEEGPAPEGAMAVSYPELTVWPWIDGKRTVADIIDSTFLSDFDVVKGIRDLLGRHLIEEVKKEVPTVPRPSRTAAIRLPRTTPRKGLAARRNALWVALALLFAVSLYFMPRNQANFFVRPPGSVPERQDFWRAVSVSRLSTLDRAIFVFYEIKGHYPASLRDLVDAGVVAEAGLVDPYGHPYRYILMQEEGRYQLFARWASGRVDPDLSLSRTLVPGVSASAPARPSKPRASEVSKPAVKLVE